MKLHPIYRGFSPEQEYLPELLLEDIPDELLELNVRVQAQILVHVVDRVAVKEFREKDSIKRFITLETEAILSNKTYLTVYLPHILANALPTLKVGKKVLSQIIEQERKLMARQVIKWFYQTRIPPMIGDNSIYAHELPIPREVKAFNPSLPHTILLHEYISHRIFLATRTLIEQGIRIELFIGPSEDLEPYYRSQQGLEKVAHLPTSSSLKYHLLFGQANKEKRIVIEGIASKSKLIHTLLQLRLVGAYLSQITIRGSIGYYQKKIENILAEKLREISHNSPIELVIIGKSTALDPILTKRFHSREFTHVRTDREEFLIRREIMKTHYHQRSIRIGNEGLLNMNAIDVCIQEKPAVILSMRMPNGELAGIVMDTIAKTIPKLQAVVMIGAAGSLREEISIGDYQITRSATYEGMRVDIPEEALLKLPFMHSSNCHLMRTRNITVYSPLLETIDWQEQNKVEMSSVDVESFHILKALEESVRNGTKVFSGAFISDVLGSGCTLVEKISHKNAWRFLDSLMNDVLDYMGIEHPIENLEVSL